MEFTVVSSHNGDTSFGHMKDVKFEYVHPTYLIHMCCDSAEEYSRSIVHVSQQPATAIAIRNVRQTGYFSSTGASVFRHARTLRTATLSYKTDWVCEEANRAPGGRFLCVSRIASIDWHDGNQSATFIGHLEAKLALGCATHKLVTRDALRYIAIPTHQLPRMTDMVRKQLAALNCIHGVNVVYDKRRTHRSLLVPQSLLSCMQLPHSGFWAILSCGIDVSSDAYLDASFEMRTRVWGSEEIGQDFRANLHGTIARFHTPSETTRIIHDVFPKVSVQANGASMELTIEFIANGDVHAIPVTVHRLRSVAIFIFHIDEKAFPYPNRRSPSAGRKPVGMPPRDLPCRQPEAGSQDEQDRSVHVHGRQPGRPD